MRSPDDMGPSDGPTAPVSPDAASVLDLPLPARRGRYCVKVATAIRRARRLVGVDRATFAALLRDRLSEDLHELAVPVDADTVAAWEEGRMAPPAVALLAAAAVTNVEVEMLLCRLPSLKRFEQLEAQVRLQVQQLRTLCKHLA